MNLNSIILLSAAILPLPSLFRSRKPAKPLPVEDIGPSREHVSQGSPRQVLPLATFQMAASVGSANERLMAMPIQAAISLYLSEIDEYVGDAIFEVAWLCRNYARFRNDRPDLALPTVTAAHMSRCLTLLGHERLRRDGRCRGGDGKRAVVFHIKTQRQQRRAAA
jgi:hypothetical protein